MQVVINPNMKLSIIINDLDNEELNKIESYHTYEIKEWLHQLFSKDS